MAKRLNYLGILNRDGLLSRTQVQEAQELMKKTGVKMPEALKQLGYVNGEQIAKAIAEEHGKRYVDLKDVAIRPAVIELISESIARENCVLPYEEDGDALIVVVSDPDDVEVFEKLRFILQRPIESVVSSREAIQEAVNQHYGQNVGESADSMIHEMTDTAINFTVVEGAGGDEAQAGSGSESDAPIVRLCDQIIAEAFQLRASDIHIEPFEDRVRIRYRIDGALVEREALPKRFQGALMSRFKILAKLDIAERRRTQDGRIKLTLGEKELDLRVSVIPTNHGQSIVMRILDKDNIRVSLVQLGFSERD